MLTIDRAWDVVPDSTSFYMTSVPNLENFIMSNNNFNNWPRPIILYGIVSYNIDILNNTMANGGGIWLMTDDRSFTTPHSHDVMFNTNIIGNSVTNTDPTTIWGSYIMNHYNDGSATPIGLGFFGLFLKNNVVTASGSPNVGIDSFYREGYYNMLAYQTNLGYAAPTDQGVIGTIYQGNTCNNCATTFWLGTDVWGTVLATTTSTGTLINNTGFHAPGAQSTYDQDTYIKP
jgi:hypothetical protein